MRVKELIEKLSVLPPTAIITVNEYEDDSTAWADELYIHICTPGHLLTSITLCDPCLDCQRLHGKLNHCTKTCKHFSDFVPMKDKE
jgi:hypothetical protein